MHQQRRIHLKIPSFQRFRNSQAPPATTRHPHHTTPSTQNLHQPPLNLNLRLGGPETHWNTKFCAVLQQRRIHLQIPRFLISQLLATDTATTSTQNLNNQPPTPQLGDPDETHPNTPGFLFLQQQQTRIHLQLPKFVKSQTPKLLLLQPFVTDTSPSTQHLHQPLNLVIPYETHKQTLNLCFSSSRGESTFKLPNSLESSQVIKWWSSQVIELLLQLIRPPTPHQVPKLASAATKTCNAGTWRSWTLKFVNNSWVVRMESSCECRDWRGEAKGMQTSRREGEEINALTY